MVPHTNMTAIRRSKIRCAAIHTGLGSDFGPGFWILNPYSFGYMRIQPIMQTTRRLRAEERQKHTDGEEDSNRRSDPLDAARLRVTVRGDRDHGRPHDSTRHSLIGALFMQVLKFAHCGF